MSEPLGRFTSIKIKLGVVVAASVLVAAVLATLSEDAGVPAWLAIPVTVALALGVTQLLASGMTSPLRQMTAASRQVARGEYGVRVPEHAGDEVGELGRAINQMARDLSVVDAHRRELVATVSHELRTPLTGLIATLENLEVGISSPDSVRVALDQAERLSGLVRDLLDLSRLESGGYAIDAEQVSVADLVRGAVDEVQSLGRPVEIDVVVPDDLVVPGDPARLRQLLANLLDNASRHSPAGARVSVTVTTDDAGWRLVVGNDGPPITSDVAELITRRSGFLGGLDSGALSGGTGLGLAIVAWVAELHGGRVQALDPDADGVRLAVDLPLEPTPLPDAPTTGAPMTTVTPPPPVEPLAEALDRPRWNPNDAAPRPLLLAGSAVVGLLASLLVAEQLPGIGWVATLLAGGAVVVVASRHRADRFTQACAALAAASVTILALRDALWIGVLCTFSAAVLCVVGSTRFRSATGFVLSGLLWPLSAIHGIPWVGRTITALSGRGAPAIIAARTVAIAAGALVVFGLLFASADAVFASWVNAVVPDLGDPGWVFRVFVGVAVAGLVLATSYFALNPPGVEDGRRPARPVGRRFEWVVPVLVVDAVFVLFLIAQAPALLGNHDYIRRTTGLTYADYTHQGFGQLTVAAALSFAVIALVARKAPLADARDRLWFRVSLGVLGVATLVVVASALHRIGLYQEAYGYTRLRILVVTFEVWLGLVMVVVLAAGVRLRGSWLPRFVVLSGASALLLLGLSNPDALIAELNIDHAQSSGQELDTAYLAQLSADAVPVIAEMSTEDRACVAASRYDSSWFEDDHWWETNWGRERAAPYAPDFRGPVGSCPTRY